LPLGVERRTDADREDDQQEDADDDGGHGRTRIADFNRTKGRIIAPPISSFMPTSSRVPRPDSSLLGAPHRRYPTSSSADVSHVTHRRLLRGARLDET
jgi:hypothetical protein